MAVHVVDGLSLYVRAISRTRHGTPAQFAKRMKSCGLSWIALGAIVQLEGGKTSILNKPETIERYADALQDVGISVYVWGYPWQGREAEFVKVMYDSSPGTLCALLDPELGANPSRSRSAAAYRKANDHAALLVRMMAERGFHRCGLSTFGTIQNFRWFPLEGYLDALVQHFPGACFAGGQTYTDDSKIDLSMAAFLSRFGLRDIQLVPNFGLYSWAKVPAGAKRKARAKTREELRSHLYEFVDEGEPVHALIGWAENFLTDEQIPALAQFSTALARGAAALPPLLPGSICD